MEESKKKILKIAGTSALGVAAIVFASLFTWKCITGGNGGNGGGEDRNDLLMTLTYNYDEENIPEANPLVPYVPETLEEYKTISFEYSGYMGKIDWGDGTEEYTSDDYNGFVKHTYENATEGSSYKISVYGDFTVFSSTYFHLEPDMQYIIGLYDYGNYMINEVEIAEGVTYLPERALALMENINKITFPSTIKELGMGSCATIGGVLMPSNNKNESTLTKIELPEGLIKIDGTAFAGCGNITEFKLPSTLEYIGGTAFAGCISLETIDIPDSVTFLGGSAFMACLSLKDVKISDDSNLKVFGKGIFSTETIMCADPLVSFENGIKLPKNIEIIGAECYSDCLPNEVEDFELDIPSTLRYIDIEAFNSLGHLTGTLDLTHVKYVGRDAFSNAYSQEAEDPLTIKVPKGYDTKWDSSWIDMSSQGTYFNIVEVE